MIHSQIYHSISDVGTFAWYVDMDPHSLVPPYFAADVGTELASQADLVNVRGLLSLVQLR